MGKMKKWRLPLIISAISCFTILIVLVKSGLLDSLNEKILRFFIGIRTPFLTVFMKICTMLGNWYAYVMLCAVLLIPKKTRHFAISLGGLLVLSDGVKTLLKIVLLVPRPDLPQLVYASGFGFPSGHTMAGFCLAFWSILSLYKSGRYKKQRAFAAACMLLIAALIAVSRVYLGVHSPTDILGGFFAATAVSLCYTQLYTKYLKKFATKL